jgi:prepilin-type N-terminal cleavage/methylation domain-containing protein
MLSDSFKNRESFTLIELLVVIAVIGLLASIVIVNLTGTRTKANIARGLQFSQSVHNALGSEAVGIWSFDEGSGTTANDASGYNNHGTLVNGPVWRCAGTDPDYTPSSKGCSVQLDGGNDYITVASQPNLTSITFLAWVKFDEIVEESSTQNYIASNSRDCCGIYNGFDFRVYNKKTAIRIWNSSASTLEGIINLSPNIWYYLGFSYDGSTLTLYNNGIIERSANTAIGLGSPPSFNLAIGAMGYSPASYNMKGFIDEVRIYEKALETAQIETMYYAGLEKLLAEDKITEKEYRERLALR